ncbi:MAG: TonB-dependent receptor, partial [Bacteroidota bacterium]
TLTARVEKTFHNLYASIAYTYSKAKNIAEGGSTASSLWSARAVSNADPNADNLAYGSYYQPHRVIAFASYRLDYGKHFATSVGAVFEAAPAGVSSYIYSTDLNGDGNTNDLVYIPRNASEINLVKVGSGGNGTGASTDPRSGTIGTGAAATASASQIWVQLDNYIKQDRYLYSRRGDYATANACVYPFYKRLDFNITQDIYFDSKSGTDKDKHTLRISLDIINAGNFINKNWGLVKTPTLTSNASGYQLLTYEGLDANGKPSYSFPYLDAANQVPRSNSFTNSTGIGSRWQMQFGIRYLFN